MAEGGSARASSRPAAATSAPVASSTWEAFLRVYDGFLTRELALRHPQFALALRQLEQNSRVERERQSEQILLALRHKDARIAELQQQRVVEAAAASEALETAKTRGNQLQTVVKEQREQIDVLLDELERVERSREAQRDAVVLVSTQVQTEERQERPVEMVEAASQTVEEAGRDVSAVLTRLEQELKTLERRNLTLERELQRRLPDTQALEEQQRLEEVKNEGYEGLESCLKTLQRGVDLMNQSNRCLHSPWTFFTSDPQEMELDGAKQGEARLAQVCMNLEHRLETQTIRLEHVQECFYLWRESAVQMMKQPDPSHTITEAMAAPSCVGFSNGQMDGKEEGEMTCPMALRGVLAQIRHALNQLKMKSLQHQKDWDAREARVLRELSRALGKEKGGVKAAAKIVEKWAGWEASHLKETRSLRQGFAEERSVAHHRRQLLLAQLSQSTQRELDLRAEANALRKPLKRQENGPNNALILSSSTENGRQSTCAMYKEAERLSYPRLLLRLASIEQEMYSKDDQLKIADETIRALSSCSPTAVTLSSHDEAAQPSIESSVDPVTHLTLELRRATHQKMELFRRREKELVNASQYFQLENACLQFQSRLEVEKKRVEALEAAQSVCEQERTDLQMKVEKLEMEALLASVSPIPSQENSEALGTPLHFASRRLRLLEDDRKRLIERLRRAQEQVALLQRQTQEKGEQRRDLREDKGSFRVEPSLLQAVAEHHQACVSQFRELEGSLGPENDDPLANDRSPLPRGEWVILVRHYEALWLAFHCLHSFLTDGDLPDNLKASNEGSMLRLFGCQDQKQEEAQPDKVETVDLELAKRDEKILLLQQMLVDRDEQIHGQRHSTDRSEDSKAGDADFASRSVDRELPSVVSVRSQTESRGVDSRFVNGLQAEIRDAAVQTDAEAALGPFLAAATPQGSSFQLVQRLPGGETAFAQVTRSTETAFEAMERHETAASTTKELEQCLAKCALLTEQNAKLTRRLRLARETNKQHAEEQQEQQTRLSASLSGSTVASAPLQQPESVGKAVVGDIPLEDADSRVNAVDKRGDSSVDYVPQSEPDALRQQLASREQENLTLVQSLCAIKEKYSQLENAHRQELRSKADEHAIRMESYMETVNERLSRIESDKHRVEEDNAQLRSKLQQFEENNARLELLRAQRSSKGTSIDPDCVVSEATVPVHEMEALQTRLQDLEVQLARERKLCEAVERKQELESQQGDREESQAKERYDSMCESQREWRFKLQREFTEYQVVQEATQQESDKRIAFLSACIEEFTRLATATSPSGGKTPPTTKELYDLVLKLARNAPFTSNRRPQPLLNEAGEQDETQRSTALWWQLRATKLEVCIRAAELRNDVFEESTRRLELSMNEVKEELAVRLARESLLSAKHLALRNELATVKEQAVAMMERYQQVSAELEKRETEATRRGDESQRNRLAIQRKTELLTQQKARVAALERELQQASKKTERLIVAEKQTAMLQQKAKEHTQQLQQARQSFARCHDDNVQLSLHLEKTKARHAAVLARLKAAKAENTQLRTQVAELKGRSQEGSPTLKMDGEGRRDLKAAASVASDASIAALTEELRALKRRVLQKQDMIVSYKAKVVDLDSHLTRQRDAMLKLVRTNRDLQRGQRQHQQQEQERAVLAQSELETRLEEQQMQLDGLRASVYDSFEAFVYCQAGEEDPEDSPSSSGTASIDSPLAAEDEKLLAIRRWTAFSASDLQELSRPVATSGRRPGSTGTNSRRKQRTAVVALRDVEDALETTPQDCRAEICQLIEHLCCLQKAAESTQRLRRY